LKTANGKLKTVKFVSIYCYESPFPKIPPGLPSKRRRALEIEQISHSAFSPFEKGEEGGFKCFSKD